MPVSITMELKTMKTIASTDFRRTLLNERLGFKLLYGKTSAVCNYSTIFCIIGMIILVLYCCLLEMKTK